MSGLTIEEERAIASLRRLAKTWPRTLKLFSAAGSLIVIPNDDTIWDESGERLREDAVLETITGIPNDGGDPW